MKKFHVKLITLLLAVASCFMMLPSCNKDVGSEDTSQSDIPSPPEKLILISDGISNCRIVRSASATNDINEIAKNIATAIGSYTGVTPKIGTDLVSPGKELDHSTVEILIGITDYTESSEALSTITYGDYILKVVGNKLVINSSTLEGLKAAMSEFNKILLSNAKEGDFSVSSDICNTGTSVKMLNSLPTYTNGNLLPAYDAGDNCKMLMIENTNMAEYSAYCEALSSSGYTLYTENEIANNSFATYTNDSYIVNTCYYENQKATQIIVEPLAVLPEHKSDSTFEKLVEPSVAMLGQAFPIEGLTDKAQSGLSMIFQASDGSFIIIDGGYVHSDTGANLIYEYLLKHAPDPDNIVIDSWIITHAHTDHVGGFTKFADYYADKVKLVNLIVNFPSDQAKADGGISNDLTSSRTVLQKVKNFQNTKVIKAHAGYRFYCADISFEVLYTHENLYPSLLTRGNSSSIVLNVEMSGQKLLMLADATEYVCKVLADTYGEYLKSDIVTTAHHGAETGADTHDAVISVYRLASAPVVLWPSKKEYYDKVSGNPHNAYLINSDSTKEIFVADNRIIRLVLPYAVGTSGIDVITKGN